MKKDKKQHILCGIIAAIVVGFLTYLVSGEAAGYNVAAGVYSALAGGFVAGCVKEYCDNGYSFDPTTWDCRDIGCTMIGAVIVAAGILLLHFAKGISNGDLRTPTRWFASEWGYESVILV